MVLGLLAVLVLTLGSLWAMPGLRKSLVDAVMLAWYNAVVGGVDTKVLLWGKVLDQDGHPIEGASITASVTTLRMVKVKGGYREYAILTTQSAADGTFKLEGAEGLYLDIERLGKEGYVLPSAYQFGTTSNIGLKYFYRYLSFGNLEKVFKPDPTHPEVFHLWKLRKPEPLEIHSRASPRGGPEFTVGAPATPLRTISVMITDVGTAQAPQWEVTVTTLEQDGGVVKADATDVFLFEAPATGYTKSIKFRYGPEGASDVGGDPGAPVRFFVRSDGGRSYGAGETAFFKPHEDGVVVTSWRSWRNPNGSRNLEHDAANPWLVGEDKP